MRKKLQKHLFIILGWFFIILAAIGFILPLLPTTPFLIIALALFSKSSPKFHQFLLSNVLFGPILKQWEDNKSLSRKTKYKATLLIIISFSISVLLVRSQPFLQLLLISTALILLILIWRIKE